MKCRKKDDTKKFKLSTMCYKMFELFVNKIGRKKNSSIKYLFSID